MAKIQGDDIPGMSEMERRVAFAIAHALTGVWIVNPYDRAEYDRAVAAIRNAARAAIAAMEANGGEEDRP